MFSYFSKAREELKKKRGEAFSYPVLAFHGTAIANIIPICETGFKMPGKSSTDYCRKNLSNCFLGQTGFKHATDTGFYGRGAYFSVIIYIENFRIEILYFVN